MAAGHNMLIHCINGRDRSAAVLAAFLYSCCAEPPPRIPQLF